MQVQANGLTIEVDVQGPADGEPVLLIMGLGMQLVAWPQHLVDLLVAQGFQVIRHDNRDIGLSQPQDHLGVPSLGRAAMRFALGLPVAAPYTLADLADDAAALLQALGHPRAHVCGASMGGMVAQHLAVRHPERVTSLTLLMTSSGARHLPRPAWRVQQALLRRPRRGALDEEVAHLVQLLQLIGSPAHPGGLAEAQERVRSLVQRSHRPQATLRQMLAILADGDRSAMLGGIHAPTAVVHGAADPLIPPAAGTDLARKIAGATLDLVPGMGHDLPLPLMPHLAGQIAAVARRGGWAGPDSRG